MRILGDQLIQALKNHFGGAASYYPAFTGKRAEFWRGFRDSDIAISSLSWIERGSDGEPDG